MDQNSGLVELQPLWRPGNPGLDDVWSFLFFQFLCNGLGYQNVRVKWLEYVYRADPNEIIEWTDIGDNDHVRSDFRFSSSFWMVARSCSRSSTV